MPTAADYFIPDDQDYLRKLNLLVDRMSQVMIEDRYFFATTSARDIHFATHPEELVNRLLVAIGLADPFAFTRWLGGAWTDVTQLVIIGARPSNEMPTANTPGQESAPGDDPLFARANHQHATPPPNAAEVLVEATSFSGNLTPGHNTVQKVAEAIDALTVIVPGGQFSGYPLIHTNQKISSIISKVGQLSIGVLGDSYSDNLSDVANFGLNYCWQKPVANQLRRATGDAGAGWVGFGWSWYTQLRGNIRPEEVSVSLSGAWDKYSDVIDTAVVSALHTVPSPDMEGIRSSSVGASMTIAGTTHCDSIKLFYQVTAAASSIRYSFDAGASWTAINTHAGTGIALLSGVPITAWSLRIEVVSGTPILYGLDVRRVDPGIVWHNLAPSGASAHGWSIQAETTAWRANIASIGLDLVIILLSTNDSVIDTPATFKERMQSLINSVRVACPQCDILLISPPQSGRSDQLYPISQYLAKQQELSTEYRIPLIDLQPMFGATFADYSWDSVRQWMQYDKLHPTVDGARIISWAVMQQLWGAPAAATGTGTDSGQTVQASGSFPDGIIVTKTINEHTPSDIPGYYAGGLWVKTTISPAGSDGGAGNYFGGLIGAFKVGPNGAASITGLSNVLVSGPKDAYPMSSGHVGLWTGAVSGLELHGTGTFDTAIGTTFKLDLHGGVSGTTATTCYLPPPTIASEDYNDGVGVRTPSVLRRWGMAVGDFSGGFAFWHISGVSTGEIPILGSPNLASGASYMINGVSVHSASFLGPLFLGMTNMTSGGISDSDSIPVSDASSGTLTRMLWSSCKAALKSYLAGFFLGIDAQSVGDAIAAADNCTDSALTDNEQFALSYQNNGGRLVHLTFATLKTKLSSYFNSLYLGTSGNAASATKLNASRLINGVPFDGTANISVTPTASYHIMYFNLAANNTDTQVITTAFTADKANSAAATHSNGTFTIPATGNYDIDVSLSLTAGPTNTQQFLAAILKNGSVTLGPLPYTPVLSVNGNCTHSLPLNFDLSANDTIQIAIQQQISRADVSFVHYCCVKITRIG